MGVAREAGQRRNNPRRSDAVRNLQGVENERAARAVEALLRRFDIVSLADDTIAWQPGIFALCGDAEITVRKTIDLIGTWCIENRTFTSSQ